MPCYTDTIVRVKYVRQSGGKGDSNFRAIWAVGTYPVEREDNEIEMVLFVPVNPDERDLETQAVFEKDSFYSVGGKIVPSYYGGKKRPKVERSNKCPLKVSLVGISQELPRVIGSNENAIFNVSISDYVGQSYDFIVKVVFPNSNSRFGNLKNTIRSQNSLIFIVGQMEIIDDDFYVYAKEINSIDTHFLFKQNVFSNNESSNVSELANTTRSKLLSTHRNIIENLKGTSDIESTFSGDHVDKVRSYLYLSILMREIWKLSVCLGGIVFAL
ncbi:5460_t:CDS:2, partial [Cetraspora pellucida]